MRTFGLYGRTEDTLWTLIAAPTIWGFHFLISYFYAAYRCAPNADTFKPIYDVRIVVGVVTVVALVLIGLTFRRAWREWRRKGAGVRHDRDTEEDREHFLEFSTLLLAALSFVAVAFEAMPVLLITDCR